MDYVALTSLAAVGAVTITIYTIANYFSSPITQLIKSLVNKNDDNRITQAEVYELIQLMKDTEETSALLPSSTNNNETAITVSLLKSGHGLKEEDLNFQTCLQNLQTIVHGMTAESVGLSHMETLRTTAFDKTNKNHIDLLHSLWNLLCPNRSRVPLNSQGADDPIKSKSWGTIGFQGVDPSTDFRGMGMLGLFQLVHFARSRHSKTVLKISQAPENGPEVKFFPFACAGIQITNLVLTLARERLLSYVMTNGEMSCPSVQENQLTQLARKQMKNLLKVVSPESSIIDWNYFCLLNDVYCEIFIMLGDEWRNQNPPDVMSFGPIFKDVEEKVRSSLTQSGGGGTCSEFEIRWRR
jgi:hypothetical protein